MPLVLGSDLTTYAIETFAGKVLDVKNIAVADRTPLQQWGDVKGPNQRFYIDPCGADVFRVIARHSGRVLDLSGPDGAGATVWQFAWAAVENQRWRIEDAGKGLVRIVSAWKAKATDPDLLLDVAGADSAEGAGIIVWPRNGGANQSFKLR